MMRRGASILMSGAVSITLAASVRNPDVRALAVAAGWRGSGKVLLRVNVGVDVAGLFIPSTIPDYCLTIVNRGRIGGVISGGKGLQTASRIYVDNTGGTIQGSGGAGGRGGVTRIDGTEGYSAAGSAGSGGNGAGFSDSGAVVLLAQTAGSPGSKATLGGPNIGGVSPGTSTGGNGGNGGALNAAGSSGGYPTLTPAYNSSTIVSNPGGGGQPGAAVDGDSKIVWQAQGTINGARIN